MTMKASTIGCGYDIKQLYTVTLGDPFRGDPCGQPLGRDPVIELVCHRDVYML